MRRAKPGERLNIIKRSLFGYCRSTLYAAVFACSFPFMTCYPAKLGFPVNCNTVWLGVSFVGSWAIFIEHRKDGPKYLFGCSQNGLSLWLFP